MASPAAAPRGLLSADITSSDDIKVEVRPRATSGQLTRQATMKFTNNSLAGMGMNAIAKKALEAIQEDGTIPQAEQQKTAVKVMKQLLRSASMEFRDRAVETAVAEAIKANKPSGCTCVIL